jgi:alpha-L-rhamnosidase
MALIPILLVLASGPATLIPTTLRTEAMINPVGIGTLKPRFSWKLAPTARSLRNLKQTGYRLVVVHGSETVWDTGQVASDNTVDVVYEGKPLAPDAAYQWKVQTQDQNGAWAWGKPARFSVGLLKPSDWKAQWIGLDLPRPTSASKFRGASWIWASESEAGSRTFRRTVNVREGLLDAKGWITADDQFSMTVNGQKVAASDGNGDAWRRPVALDLKGLKTGDNIIEVTATNDGGAAGLLARIEFRYGAGTTETLVTDASWKATTGTTKVVGAFGTEPWGQVGSAALILPAPKVLAHSFEAQKSIRRATLYGSALGLIELHLNGRKVADEFFVPGWTDYEKRVYARAYDVTSLVKKGSNNIQAILGDGWYSGYVGFGGRRDHYGVKTRALVQLNLEYSDGSKNTVVSSPSWKAGTGPILESDFLMGESVDARIPVTTTASPSTGTEVKPMVEMFPGQPVTRYAELKAKSVRAVGSTYILDFGQNLAGFARLKVSGKPGQKITLRFAERLNPDGSFYVTNLRGARAIDTFVCSGNGLETWEPKFTFHGFQYLEVSGLPEKPKPDTLIAVALSSDTPNVGSIHTSDTMLNKLVSNAWWTQKMNFIDIPTDCPQRDERLGWTGDAQAYIRTAAMLTDVQPFFTKWLVALEDGQRADGQFPTVAPVKVSGDDGGPAWADAGVICPWTIYDVYGDRQVLERHYPSMAKFVEFCMKRSTSDRLPPPQFHCFGDWLNINSPTPNEVIYTAYFAGSARIVSLAATALGRTADAIKYARVADEVKAAFVKEYVSPNGTVKGDSQCAYVLALGFDLLDERLAKLAADRLVADIEKRGGHLSTGFVGTRDIMHVLSKIGRNDVAFKLLHNTTFPSWGFTIKNGATSIWERWDGWTPDKGFQDAGMNSFAHYAFGAVVGWVMAQPVGITNLTPGFQKVKIAPQIDPKLRWLKAHYDSVRGRVQSSWSVSGKRVTLNVTVPPNVTAEVHVPGGKVHTVGSGEYTFVGSR